MQCKLKASVDVYSVLWIRPLDGYCKRLWSITNRPVQQHELYKQIELYTN